MGLVSGSASVTRFRVTARPDDVDFEPVAFRAIEPGAQVRERVGVVPFEPGAPYRIGHTRWAFRVRVDRLRPDPTLVAERLKELVAAERDATGEPYVAARIRKKLRQQAEEELLIQATPRSKVIECVLDDHWLYVGSTANTWLGMVLAVARQVDIVADFSAPWLDRGDPPLESELVEAKEPWQSVRGCRFLKALLSDPEVMVEPESGGAKLATRDARVSLTGGVVNELTRYLERDAELLNAKLLVEDMAFRLDALNWRVTSLKIEHDQHDSWIDTLGERLEAVEAVFETLDGRYATLASKIE